MIEPWTTKNQGPNPTRSGNLRLPTGALRRRLTVNACCRTPEILWFVRGPIHQGL
jgi:hypothetical protein